MDSRERFAKTLRLSAVAHDYEIKPGLAEVYWAQLQEFSHEDVDQAFALHMRISKWFPKLVEIIDLLIPAEATIEQEAVSQWDSVVSKLANSWNAKAGNPITERVVNDLGGWVQLGRTATEKLVWVQKEFVRRYVMHTETGMAPIRRIGSDGPVRIGEIV